MKYCLFCLVIIFCRFQSSEAGCVDQVEHVSLVHGHYLEGVIDLTVVAPDPLVLSRFYSSRDSDRMVTIGGWCFNPHTFLSVHKDLKEGTFRVQATDPDGTISTYVSCQSRSNPSKHISFKMNPIWKCVNGEGIDRLMSMKGQDLYFNSKADSFEMFLCSGGKRFYVKHPSVFDVYVMEHEVLPSGNKVFYEWDEQGRLIFIKETNNSEKKILAWIRLSHEGGIYVETSNGKIAEYRFQQEGSGPQLLTEVHTEDRSLIRYEYQILEDHIFLHRKSGSEGKLEQIDYYEEAPYKVRSITDEAGSVQFSYKDDFITEINGFYEGKAVCQCNEKGQVIAIQHYLGDGSLYRVYRRSWDINLLAESTEDAAGNVLYCKEFIYNGEGDLVGEGEYGEMTKRYSYFSDRNIYGFTQTDTQGVEIKYWYKKGTQQLLKKCITAKSDEGTEIRERHFYTYNEDAILIQEIVDDGKEINKSVKECTGVTERTMTVIFPKQDLPNVGVPQVIEQKYGTIDGSLEFLLKRTVNQLDDRGNVVSETVYDENGDLCYTTSKGYDQGLLVFKTDPLGHATYYSYDKNRNLILEKCSGKELFIEYEYDVKNRLVSTTLQDREGNRLEIQEVFDRDFESEGLLEECSYDYKGRPTKVGGKTYRYDTFHKISETDEKGELTTYTYANSGRLTAFNKGGRKVEFIYDSLGRVHGVKKWKSESAFTLEIQEYDLLDRVTEKRIEDQNGKVLLKTMFVYNDAGYLAQVIGYPNNKESVIAQYEYDGFGRACGESKDLKVYRDDDRSLLKKVENGPEPYQLNRIYDGEGKIQTLQLPDGSSIEYDYEGPFIKGAKRISKEGQELYEHRVVSRDLMGNILEETLPGNLGSRKQFWDGTGRRVIRLSTDFFQDSQDEAEILEGESNLKENRFCKQLGSKGKKTAKNLFYLGDVEIGLMDENGFIAELKVPSDPNNPGAACIAIEIKKEIYVPLYDLKGNIVYLLDHERRKTIRDLSLLRSGGRRDY